MLDAKLFFPIVQIDDNSLDSKYAYKSTEICFKKKKKKRKKCNKKMPDFRKPAIFWGVVE